MPSIGPDDAALHPGQIGHASPLLFTGLVDDAAMFPPGNAPLDRALVEHARPSRRLVRRAGRPAAGAGRPAARSAGSRCRTARFDSAGDLGRGPRPGVGDRCRRRRRGRRTRSASRRSSCPSPRSPATRADRRRDASWPTRGVVSAARPRGLVGGDPRPPVRGPSWTAGRRRTAGAGPVARSSGPAASSRAAVPSEIEVATFLRHAIDVDLTFKLTAGLHHAVRCTDDRPPGSSSTACSTCCAPSRRRSTAPRTTSWPSCWPSATPGPWSSAPTA